MSHRIKRFATFAIFACFYRFAAMDSISGLFGHQVDTKLDTKTITATTKLVYQTNWFFGVLAALSPQENHSHERRFPDLRRNG
jgi:hypothetical protein